MWRHEHSSLKLFIAEFSPVEALSRIREIWSVHSTVWCRQHKCSTNELRGRPLLVKIQPHFLSFRVISTQNPALGNAISVYKILANRTQLHSVDETVIALLLVLVRWGGLPCSRRRSGHCCELIIRLSANKRNENNRWWVFSPNKFAINRT